MKEHTTSRRKQNGAGDLVILVDRRERKPLQVDQFLPAIEASLYTGDYSIAGAEDLFAVERKSLSDLTSTLSSGRDRFEREMLRLRGYRFRRLLIVANPVDVEDHIYRSRIAPASVFGSLAAYEIRYDVPVVWEPDAVKAAKLVCRWAHYFWREQLRLHEKVKTCNIEHHAAASTLQLVN